MLIFLISNSFFKVDSRSLCIKHENCNIQGLLKVRFFYIHILLLIWHCIGREKCYSFELKATTFYSYRYPSSCQRPSFWSYIHRIQFILNLFHISLLPRANPNPPTYHKVFPTSHHSYIKLYYTHFSPEKKNRLCFILDTSRPFIVSIDRGPTQPSINHHFLQ